MSKFAAAIASSCRLHSGGRRGVLAILVLLPSAVLAANPDPALRRSDQIDVRRLGKVSEDERSVLHIEWRAGLAGVEEKRSVQDMLDKLRRLETGISDVSSLVRNMPAQSQVVAAAAPAAPAVPAAAAVAVAAAVPVTVEAADTDGYNLRLMVANLAALAIVALWWFRRRKPAAQPEKGLASLLEDAPSGVTLRSEPPPVMATPVTVLATTPEAEATSGVEMFAKPEAVAETLATPGDEAARSVPGAAADQAPELAPLETAKPITTTISSAPETNPSESFAANETMISDFSLEAAEPEVVARENEKLQTLPPISPPEPSPTPSAPQKADVEPTLQLAEIMLSMGLEQGAAQALIEYTEANPRHAIYHWLKLLGIYRSRGLKKEFAATAEKLRMYFNIQAAEWGTPVASEAPALEHFSRVAEHVQKIWWQPGQCITYLRRLLEDNRDGARAGFPQSVAEEILLLIELQKDLSGANQPAA